MGLWERVPLMCVCVPHWSGCPQEASSFDTVNLNANMEFCSFAVTPLHPVVNGVVLLVSMYSS